MKAIQYVQASTIINIERRKTMGIKTYNPYTPSRRNMTGSDFSEITKTTPEKSLVTSLKKNAGRNNQGKITVRHHGGGNRRKYRVIDFKRNKKDGIPAKVIGIVQIKDPREQDIFCSLLTRKDGMQELAEKYGLSAKELASMYERSVEEIMDDWDAMAQERQELQAIRVRYRNCRSLLSKRNIDRTPVRVVVPFKERGIPVEYLKMLSTPLAVLEITPRILRRLREYNIYLLEDLLRFVKKNGFNALAKLHGIGMKSCEDLYSALKQKGIMESKDNCHLFQYIWV